MKKELKWFVFFSSILLLFCTACSDDKENDLIVDWLPEEPVSETRLVDEFIAAYVQDAYLWTSTIAWSSVHPEEEIEPFEFFDKLKYTEDKWSMLTDDMTELAGEFEGVSTTFGYQLIFGRISNLDALYGIILYVYPDSPAEKAGLKRGTCIVTKDFGYITEDNYGELYTAPSLLLGTASYDDGNLVMDSTMVYMFAETMYEDPVNTYKVIEKGANKIGYLCYTDYMIESEIRLQEVFSEFKLQGVTDVVLDLRYNSGGYAQTARILSSILAPASVVKGKDIFISQEWNDAYMSYFKKNKIETNEYFTDTLAVNMDLSRLFVLTSEYTASASESTIIGLDPYMDVIRIGNTTHGKYCGGVLLSPEVWDESTEEWVAVEEIDNWGLYLMVYRFANKNGITSFTGGLEPDVLVEEDYVNLYPFGDERDPLLAEAISRITGEPVVGTRSAKSSRKFQPERSISTMKKALDGKMIDTRPLPKLNK
ncbi:MAG: hypothetical protein LBV72_05955 [Tannerella sp.]|jgi:C-terminal processing protease CtpA/Prc|nr:hypothetical protein [Tannerella sp.]